MIPLLLAACAPEPCSLPTDDTLGPLTPWEEVFLAEEGIPQSPSPAYMTAEDGVPLAYHDWVPEGWDGTGPVVLLFHGSSAYAEVYGVLGRALAEEGVYARLPDLRGHGRSVCPRSGCGDPETVDRAPADDGVYWPGRPGDAGDEDQLVRDLTQHLADLREAWPEARLHLAGHSSGGGLVSRAVERGAAAMVDSVALIAPYTHADAAQVRPEVRLDCPEVAGTAYARVDLGALGAALRGDPHRYVLSFEKGELATDQDTLAYTWPMMTGLATNDPTTSWSAYTVPLLVVVGEEDALLDPTAWDSVLERTPGPSQLWRVPETSHIGLTWSDEVGVGLAGWFREGIAP